MTGYFDDWDDKLREARSQAYAAESVCQGTFLQSRAWVALEEKLVYDVTLAAESPGFPEDLRKLVHEVVLRHAVEMRPVTALDNLHIETQDDVYRELGSLSHKLHTVFHELSTRNIDGFSDSPLAPMRVLYARGEEYREQLVEATKRKDRTP